jgi:hypothetical protein
LQYEQIRAVDGARLDSLLLVQSVHGSFLSGGGAARAAAESDL